MIFWFKVIREKKKKVLKKISESVSEMGEW